MFLKMGRKLYLNPAPAAFLSDELLSKLYIIAPNETEAELLTGIKVLDLASGENAAKVLLSKGIPVVIVTLGSKGALFCTIKETKYLPNFYC